MEVEKGEPLLRWFDTTHLRYDLKPCVDAYRSLALELVVQLKPSAERTLALRDLIRSKDNAVRALILTQEEV